MSIAALDALVIRKASERNPVTVQWPFGGTQEFELTAIKREIMRDYPSAGGGYIEDSPVTLLGAQDWYVLDGADSDAPAVDSAIGIYCDTNGAPVSRTNDETATVIQHRIKRIGPSAGGLTYELESKNR